MYKLLVFIFLFISISSFAQTALKRTKKNVVAISVGQFHFFNVSSQKNIPVSVVGLNYSRQIKNNISLKVSYSFWRRGNGTPVPSIIYLSSIYDLNNTIGQKYAISKFQYFDIGLKYEYKIAKNHLVPLWIGPSFASMNNSFIKSQSYIFYSGSSEPHIIAIDSYSKTGESFGMFFGLGYSYNLCNEKFSIGAELNGRYYHEVPFHFVYGLNFGLNF